MTNAIEKNIYAGIEESRRHDLIADVEVEDLSTAAAWINDYMTGVRTVLTEDNSGEPVLDVWDDDWTWHIHIRQ